MTLYPKFSKKREGPNVTCEQKLLQSVNNLILNTETCTGCGICAEACPEEAITVSMVGATKREHGIDYASPIEIDEKKCSYCGVCQILCPFDALTLKIDGEERLPILEKEGFPQWDQVSSIDQEKCVKCTICEDVCPRDAIIRDVPDYEGELKDTIANYDRGETDPKDAVAQYKLATALSRVGRYEEALRAYDKTLELDPRNALALYNKGIALARLGKYEDAMRAYDDARAINLDADTLANLSKYSQGKPRHAALKTKTTFEVDKEKCNYCGICGTLCPAITVKRKEFTAETGKVEGDVLFDEEKCDGCKICVEACPEECITLNREIISDKLEGEVNIDKDLCCTCSWCSTNCPTEAISMEKLFEGDISVDESKCPSGCSTCIEVCPCNAIYLPSPPPASEMRGEQEAKIAINKDLCILCGACVYACPGEDVITLRRTGMRMKGTETDLFKRIKEKLCTPRTSMVKETVEPGTTQVKVLES
jgi:4Fe-4S ferredoxin